MKKLTLISALISVITASLPSAWSQEVTKVGTTAANFLKLEVGARAVAMAGAFTAVANDGSALYWNPAGLARLHQFGLSYHNVDLYAGIRHQFVGIMIPAGDNNTFGVSFNYVDLGEIEQTTIREPDGTGLKFGASDLAVGISYSRNLTDRVAFGITGHYIHEKIWTESGDGYAFDFGTLFEPGVAGLRIGMTITNLGPEMRLNNGPNLTFQKQQNKDFPGNRRIPAQFVTQHYELPLTFRLGVQLELFGSNGVMAKSEENRVTVVAEVNDAFDNALRSTYAVEYWWRNTLALRGGLRQNFDLARFSFGGGLQVPVKGLQFRFDYALADYGDLGTIGITSVDLAF